MGAGRGGDEGKFSEATRSHEKLQSSPSLLLSLSLSSVRPYKPKQTCASMLHTPKLCLKHNIEQRSLCALRIFQKCVF